jgi:hypothetical protein
MFEAERQGGAGGDGGAGEGEGLAPERATGPAAIEDRVAPLVEDDVLGQ